MQVLADLASVACSGEVESTAACCVDVDCCSVASNPAAVQNVAASAASARSAASATSVVSAGTAGSAGSAGSAASASDFPFSQPGETEKQLCEVEE